MSENIFAEIYNRILGLFGQSVQKEESKDVAINRLRLVLMQDRTNLTPELLQRMRKELIELLSKYVELDKEALELNFEQEGEQMALMLSIPVVRAKDEAEIEEALKAAEEEDAEDEDDDEQSDEAEDDDSDDDSDSDSDESETSEDTEEEDSTDVEEESNESEVKDSDEVVKEEVKPSKKSSKKDE